MLVVEEGAGLLYVFCRVVVFGVCWSYWGVGGGGVRE